MNNRLTKFYPFIFVLFWASGFIFAKMGLSNSEPFTLLSIRYFFVFFLLLIIFWIKKPAIPRDKIVIKNIIITGIMMQVFFFSCVYYAIDYGISAGLVAIIASMQPLLVGILAPFITKENVNQKQWIGLIIGFLGVFIVIFFNKEISYENFIGLFLALGALFSMSGVALFEKKVSKDYDLIVANLIQVFIGFIILTPLAYFYEGYSFTITNDFLIAMLYLVVGNSFVAVTLLYAMIRNGEATKVSALFYLIPPLAAVIAWLLLDESMTLISILGLCITVVGVYFARK